MGSMAFMRPIVGEKCLGRNAAIGCFGSSGHICIGHSLPLLKGDHARANRLAESLSEMDGLSVKLENVQTNMVYVRTERPASEWQQNLSDQGLLCFALDENSLRLVTHLHIDDQKIDQAIQIFTKVSSQ